MPVMQTEGAEVHYEIGGNGPPLMLIAGMLSDSASWGPLVQPLERHFTVIRPDNRTTGRTRHEGAARVEDMARDAARLLIKLDLGPAHVVGHSLGGLIALQLASHGAVPRSLTVAAASPVRLPHILALFDGLCRLRRQGGADWLRVLYPWLFAPGFFETQNAVEAAIFAAQAYPHGQSAEAMAAQVAAFAAFSPLSLPHVGAVPARALFASHDLIVPRAAAEARKRALGVGEVIEIANAGHSLHWDQPEAMVTALLPLVDAP